MRERLRLRALKGLLPSALIVAEVAAASEVGKGLARVQTHVLHRFLRSEQIDELARVRLAIEARQRDASRHAYPRYWVGQERSGKVGVGENSPCTEATHRGDQHAGWHLFLARGEQAAPDGENRFAVLHHALQLDQGPSGLHATCFWVLRVFHHAGEQGRRRFWRAQNRQREHRAIDEQGLLRLRRRQQHGQLRSHARETERRDGDRLVFRCGRIHCGSLQFGEVGSRRLLRLVFRHRTADVGALIKHQVADGAIQAFDHGVRTWFPPRRQSTGVTVQCLIKANEHQPEVAALRVAELHRAFVGDQRGVGFAFQLFGVRGATCQQGEQSQQRGSQRASHGGHGTENRRIPSAQWRNRRIYGIAGGMTAFPPPVHRVRVRYCETDRMAVAHHGSYVAWFEEARTEWMRSRGVSYRVMEDEGHLLQIVEFVCRYHKPVDFDDVVAISIVIAEAGHVAMTLDYRCVRERDGAVCATGSTRLACVGRDGKLRRLPAALVAD